MYGKTTLWLGFREFVPAGTKLYLHCRQCIIDEVNSQAILSEYDVGKTYATITRYSSIAPALATFMWMA